MLGLSPLGRIQIPLDWLALSLFLASGWLAMDRAAWSQSPSPAKKGPSADEVYRAEIVPVLKQFCLECHSAKKAEGEIHFDNYKDAA